MPQIVDVIPAPASKITKIIDGSGVEQETAVALREAFQPIADIISKPLAEAAAINITDESQVDEMKRAGKLRGVLKDARVKCEHLRKALKEDSLKRGNLIQSIANEIKGMIEPAEEHLMNMEKFVERAEAARREKRKVEREALLAPYSVDTSFFDLLAMPDDQFAILLDNSKTAHESRIIAAKKAEDDRLAAEKARLEDEARIKAENAKLREEADKQAKLAALERAKAEAERKAIQDEADRKLATERAERERLEQAERDRVAAEIAVKQADAAAKKKAEDAPDKAKVASIAQALNAIVNVLPECSTPEGKELVRKIGMEIIKLAERVDKSVAAM